MKLIVLLREPVQRCYSAWNMFRSFNKDNPQKTYNTFIKNSNAQEKEALKKLLFSTEFPSFTDCVNEELDKFSKSIVSIEPSFVKRGIYVEQIQNYLKYFNLDSFLFIEQRELKDIKLVLHKVSKFLDVELTTNTEDISSSSSNVGNYQKNVTHDQKTFNDLHKFYHPLNEKLFKLINTRYDWNDN